METAITVDQGNEEQRKVEKRKIVLKLFSDFPTTVRTVSGSKGMLSVLFYRQNTPIRIFTKSNSLDEKYQAFCFRPNSYSYLTNWRASVNNKIVCHWGSRCESVERRLEASTPGT